MIKVIGVYGIIIIIFSQMRDSQPQSDPNDYLVMPGSSRGPPKSNVLNRANQIRAALHSVDQSQPIDYEQQYHHVQTDYEQLRGAYEELQQFLQVQKESLDNLEAENDALRNEVARLRESRQQESSGSKIKKNQEMLREIRQQEQGKRADDESVGAMRQSDPPNLSTKYEKALKEISNLLGINKQLKSQVEYLKNNSKEDYQRTFEELVNEKNQESIRAQREQARRIEVEKLNSLYEQKFLQIKENMLKQQQLYEQKIMETIKAYSSQTEQLRKRAQQADQLEQQMEEFQNVQHSGVAIAEELRSKEAEYSRQAYQLKQAMEDIKVEAYQKQLALEREVENAKLKAQDEAAKAMRGLHQQLNTLKSQHLKLREAYEELQQDNSSLLDEIRRGSSKVGDQETGVVVELKKYIENLKAETLRLKEILNSKDQLLSDKANLNREIVNLNKQISQLSHQNAQLKSRLEMTTKKQSTLNEQIRRLQNQLEEQRAALTLKLKQKQSSIQPAPTPPRSIPDHEQTIIRLNSQIQSLRTKLGKALEFNSLQKADQHQFPKNERPIPVQIRIRQLKVLLQLLLGSSGGSSVTIETSQLLDIRTFTVEFEQRLKLCANEKQHLKRKMHDYKDRYHTTQKHANQLEQAHEQLTTKIAGYEKLVQRLQDELAKSIKKTQEATGQFTLQSLSRGQLEADLRLQINDLNEKLELQAKYFEQQLQTKVLEYEAKLVTLQKQLDSGSHELQSIGLYTNKIQELSDKLVRLEITNNQLRVQITQLEQGRTSLHLEAKLPDQGLLLKQVYEKLTEREAHVLRLEYGLKDKCTELDENLELQNEMKQQIYEQDLEIQRLKEQVRTAEEGEERIAYEAKRIDQEQSRKQAELTKINEGLRADIKKYLHFEEELTVAQQALHQLKISNSQLTQKVSQYESELSRLKQVEQNLRQLALKHNQLQNSSQYAKSVYQAEKNRLERYLRDKDNELAENSKLMAKFREEAAAEIRDLRSQLGSVEQETQTIRRNSELSKYKNSETADENVRLRAQMSSLLQEMDRYRQAQAKCYQTQRKASELGMTVDSLKYKLEFAQKQGQRMKARLQQLEQAINRGNMEVAERDRLIRVTQNTAYQTNLKLQEQTFRNSTLKSEVDRLQKVVSDMLRESMSNSRRLVQAGSSPYKEVTNLNLGATGVSSFELGLYKDSVSY